MTRLIDADKLCEEFKARQRAALRWKEKAILDVDEERKIRADATLCFLSEVKLTIDNAPTVEERPHGKWIRASNMSKKSYQRVCDQCHHISYFCGDGNYPNCPYCLAEMREADNE